MESQEAKLYRGNEYVESLCLIGYNDDFDEIVVENDGTMTVRAMEDVKENGEYVYKQTEYKGITRISFK
jgi:hypothetical protein